MLIVSFLPTAFGPSRRTPKQSKSISRGIARIVSGLAVASPPDVGTPLCSSNAPCK